ncbi:hypothetical protein TPAR_01683, partial [Tolypocladium paradoxum]
AVRADAQGRAARGRHLGGRVRGRGAGRREAAVGALQADVPRAAEGGCDAAGLGGREAGWADDEKLLWAARGRLFARAARDCGVEGGVAVLGGDDVAGRGRRGRRGASQDRGSGIGKGTASTDEAVVVEEPAVRHAVMGSLDPLEPRVGEITCP